MYNDLTKNYTSNIFDLYNINLKVQLFILHQESGVEKFLKWMKF